MALSTCRAREIDFATAVNTTQTPGAPPLRTTCRPRTMEAHTKLPSIKTSAHVPSKAPKGPGQRMHRANGRKRPASKKSSRAWPSMVAQCTCTDQIPAFFTGSENARFLPATVCAIVVLCYMCGTCSQKEKEPLVDIPELSIANICHPGASTSPSAPSSSLGPGTTF